MEQEIVILQQQLKETKIVDSDKKSLSSLPTYISELELIPIIQDVAIIIK
jgi:hypothetical protein